MKINSLGHVVLRVTSRERAERFYNGVLGLPICARLDKNGMKMAFFTLGDHHDFAVSEVSGDGNKATRSTVGLDHVAFNIGTTLEQLRDAKKILDDAGVATLPIDHEVTKSLYFQDPDGNGIEIYIDASDVWRQEPQRVAQGQPLVL